MRPDGPRDLVAGADSGPQHPFPIKLSGPVIKGFGRGSKEVWQQLWKAAFLMMSFTWFDSILIKVNVYTSLVPGSWPTGVSVNRLFPNLRAHVVLISTQHTPGVCSLCVAFCICGRFDARRS